MHLILIALAFAVFFSACGDSDSSSALYNTDIEYGALTDARDGQTYRTVPIGNQVWMAENLKYASDASFCYGDDPEYCKKYGRLYTWNDAQDVCPAGWHLPNRAEWWTLVANVGGRGEAMHALKSTSVWVSMRDTSAVATDSYGFSILPTGYKDVNKVMFLIINPMLFFGLLQKIMLTMQMLFIFIWALIMDLVWIAPISWPLSRCVVFRIRLMQS
jgi:uncharacterized protein (TIGR02145 family)